MRCIVRDRHTNAVKGYGATQPMAPERALYLLRTNPMYWELVDDKAEMPDDDRGNPHRSEMSFEPATSIGELTAPAKSGRKGE